MFKFFSRKAAPGKKSRDLAEEWRETGQVDALKQALDAGLSASTTLGSARETPLHIAARQGHLNALVLLNSRGAKDLIRDSGGQFAVHHAAENGQAESVLYLLKNMGSYVDCVDAEGRTPLALVVQKSLLEMVKLLVARGADAVHTRSKAGLASLHLCTSPQVLRYLCRFTLAWVDQPDAQGRTLLMHSSQRGHKDVISEALSLGADTSRVDQRSRNALHFAAAHGRSGVIPLLVVGGCSSNEADAEGFTAVERALLAQDAQSTYALYCAGALFTKQQLLLVGILLANSSLRQRMLALPDPVPRPPRTDAVSQLIVAYSRLLRSSKDGVAHDSTSAVALPAHHASTSDAPAQHHRHADSDPPRGRGAARNDDEDDAFEVPPAPQPLKRAKDASRDFVPQSLPVPAACPPSRMSAYCGPTSRPLFNANGGLETPGNLYRPLSPPTCVAPDRSRSMAVGPSDAADVGASNFWGRGKVLPRRMRASSESTGRRSSLLGTRGTAYKRRDPWADSPEAADKPTRAPQHHDDLAVLRLSLSRRGSGEQEEDGIAEFEEMMARRVALFQQSALADPQ